MPSSPIVKTAFPLWPNTVFSSLLVLLIAVAAMFGSQLGNTLIVPLLILGCLSAGFQWFFGERASTNSAILLLSGIFVVWTILSLCFSTTSTVGLIAVQEACALILLFWCELHKKQEEKSKLRDLLHVSLVWIAVLCCLSGIAVYVLQPFPRFVGTFFDPQLARSVFPNGFAGFLLLCWPFAWLGGTQKTSVKVAVTSLLLACLLLTLSRAAILVLLIQIAFVLWIARPSTKSLLAVVCTTALLVLGIAGARSLHFSVPSPVERITFTDESKKVPVTERRDLWAQALTLSAERPLFGWGPESFIFASQRLQTHPLAVSDDPHNVLLSLSAERGLVAAASFLFLCILAAAAAWNYAKKNALVLASMAGAGGVLLHSFLDRDLKFLAIALPFWILLGLMIPEQSSKKSKQNFFHIPVAIFLSFALLGSLFWNQKGETLLGEGQKALTENRLPEAMEILESYVSQNTQDPRGWIVYGQALAAEERDEEALAMFHEAYRLGKYNYPDALLGITSLAVLTNDQTIVGDRLASIEGMTRVFIDAIAANDHYAAILTTPEVIVDVLEDLKILNPVKTARYTELQKEVQTNADLHRRIGAQNTEGKLWR